MAEINDNTVDGLLAYCDWLVDKGYGSSSQIEPWKTAVKKVFYTVEGEDYGALNLDSLDVEDLVRRFRVLAASQYKAESITTYGSRLNNALEAHAYFREHGRPPTFRQMTKRTNGEQDQEARSKKSKAAKPKTTPASTTTSPGVGPEFFDLEYPLESGRMALLRLPKRMSKTDVDRLSTVLRTLQGEEQRQLPKNTGEDALAA